MNNDTSTYSNIRSRLETLKVVPSKRWGQNFLTNEGIAEQIARFIEVMPGDRVIEIGPGLGALTEKLYSKQLVALVEREESFCALLKERFPGLEIVNEDVREIEFNRFGSDLYVVGNLPYSLSTEIITQLIRQRDVVRKAVFLLQSEFAERIAATHGGKDYGSLSVFVQNVAQCELGPEFEGGSFYPKTDVDSRLIRLTFNKDLSVPLEFEKFCKFLFSKRRKQIHTSLRALGWVSGDSIKRALEDQKIDLTERVEKLSPSRILGLYRAVIKSRKGAA